MFFWIVISFLLAIAYAALLGLYVWGWQQLPNANFSSGLSDADVPIVGVVVAARDEERYIGSLLQCLVAQNYPTDKLQIVVVNDHSTDATSTIVAQWAAQYAYIRLLHLADAIPSGELGNAYKKLAITYAISQLPDCELVVCTDADCSMGEHWLTSLACAYRHWGCQMIAAPVCYTGEVNFVQRFQSLDFLGMMVTTGAVLNKRWADMCNGANLAYSRGAFLEVGGFEGFDHIASGDDLFLMHKIRKHYPEGIRFAKSLEATVYTYPQPNWRAFIQQRRRWASKSRYYTDYGLVAALAMVYGFHVVLVVNALAALIGASITLGAVWLGQMLLKMIADFFYLRSGAVFFGRTDLLRLFFFAEWVHIFYITVVGAWSNFGKYEWKGRQVK